MKSNDHIYDFLIVGQGLAGTILVHKLRERNTNYLIVDAEKNTASFAAAGIINPVTGRNFVKTWLIDDLIPVAIDTYENISRVISKNLGNSCL